MREWRAVPCCPKFLPGRPRARDTVKHAAVPVRPVVQCNFRVLIVVAVAAADIHSLVLALRVCQRTHQAVTGMAVYATHPRLMVDIGLLVFDETSIREPRDFCWCVFQ